MICAGCKTIIGLEEEDDTLDCAYCNKVFCSECMVAEDFWYCNECDKVFCSECTVVNYYHHAEEDDEGVEDDLYNDDHYLPCMRCAEEVSFYDVELRTACLSPEHKPSC
jgi:uncharacterized CHY-type Zn-finger protein